MNNDNDEPNEQGYPTSSLVPFDKEEEEQNESNALLSGVTNERIDFIRKVYGILTGQLAFTFGGVVLFTFQPESRTWLRGVPMEVMMACFAAAIIIELMLVCCCRHLSK